MAHGSITDLATVTGDPGEIAAGPNQANVAHQTQSPVTASATLTLDVLQVTQTKAVNPTTIVSGSTSPLAYTITVTNSGTVTTPAPIVDTDAAPSGTTLVSGSPACSGGPPTCTVAVSGSTITWTIPAGMAAGATYTLTFSVTLNASDAAGTNITNTASWTGPGCTSQTSCTTNGATTSVTAAPATAPATVTPTTAAPTPAPATTPSTSPAIAFTGAMLAQEWLIGLGALVLGSALVLLARLRRRSPKQSAK